MVYLIKDKVLNIVTRKYREESVGPVLPQETTVKN